MTLKVETYSQGAVLITALCAFIRTNAQEIQPTEEGRRIAAAYSEDAQVMLASLQEGVYR